jgi:hypothetical protein
MPDQLRPPAESARPWYRSWWGITYLTVLGLVVVIALIQSAMPASRDRFGALNLVPVAVASDIVFAIGIGILVYRRQFWRSAETGVNTLIGLALFLLGTAAAIVFVFFGCLAVSSH